ncbi:MAG: histidinol-phosphatase [Lentisphaeria bacterium]
MNNRQVNLHTHTCLCKHGEGMVPDFCAEALKTGLNILGFSEHSPFPDNRYNNTRMDYAQLELYCQWLKDARQTFPALEILSGLEIDLDPDFPPAFYREELKERFELDFLSGGVHFVHDKDGQCIWAGAGAHHPLEVIRLFTEKTIFLMESGLVEFITHPDMVAGSIDRWTPEVKTLFREVVQAASSLNIPLEVNAYGFRKAELSYPEGIRHPYPWQPFWELAAEFDVPCVIGSDAHAPAEVSSNLPEVYAFTEELGLRCVNAKTALKIIQKRTLSQYE